jgi:hypothetical protein
MVTPVPIKVRAFLAPEPQQGTLGSTVRTDVVVELGGLDAELKFSGDRRRLRPGVGGGFARATLLPTGECFIPPGQAVCVHAPVGPILGIRFRDGELRPLGEEVLLSRPERAGYRIEASMEVMTAVGVTFEWADFDPDSGPELLLGGEMRFVRGVMARVVIGTASRSTFSTPRAGVITDVTLLPPGQVIHFPDQFVAVSGDARDLAQIRLRFGGEGGKSPSLQRGRWQEATPRFSR